MIQILKIIIKTICLVYNNKNFHVRIVNNIHCTVTGKNVFSML